MRTLTAALTTAQQSASASPYVRVRAIRKIGGVGRLDWERLYTGAEPETSHAATQPADGSLVRIRQNVGAGSVSIQRIASPGPASDFATWGGIEGGAASAVAICSYGATVWAFFIAYGNGSITAKQSTDYGATWGTWTAITPVGEVPTVIAATMKDAGTVLVVFNRGTNVYRVKYSGGAWGAEANWTNMTASVTGLAVCYAGDYNLIVTGTEVTTAHPRVWSCIYGDGYSQGANTWSSLFELSAANAGSGISYSLPSLVQPDVYRAFWVETYSGSQSYTRSYFTHSPLSAEFVDMMVYNLWREPVPFNATYPQGLALAYGAGAYVWLSHSAGVWRAPLITGTGLDLTADVLSVSCHLLSPISHLQPGSALVHLRNEDGRYAAPGAGAIAALQRGSQLAIDFGYKTTTGNEVSSGPAWWIESLEHLATTGKAELVLRALDGWSLLARWTARRQFAWVEGSLSVFQILRWVFARAGLDFSGILGGASPAATNLAPGFTIQPGTSGLAAVRALLAKVPDVVIFQGAAGAIWNPSASDASSYSYVGADLVSAPAHKIRESRFAASNQQVNHAQVFGTGVFNESFSWTELELAYNRIAQAHDAGLTTAADALARAIAVLREATIEASHDALITAPNVGQEVGDVIDVTEPRANLSAAKRRVLELSTEYQPSKAVYKQTLTLGAP